MINSRAAGRNYRCAATIVDAGTPIAPKAADNSSVGSEMSQIGPSEAPVPQMKCDECSTNSPDSEKISSTHASITPATNSIAPVASIGVGRLRNRLGEELRLSVPRHMVPKRRDEAFAKHVALPAPKLRHLSQRL